MAKHIRGDIMNTNITRNELHDLIDIVDNNELNLIYSLLLKFVPEVVPEADEVNSIETAKRENIYYKAEDIDWDNLDKMDLD